MSELFRTRGGLALAGSSQRKNSRRSLDGPVEGRLSLGGRIHAMRHKLHVRKRSRWPYLRPELLRSHSQACRASDCKYPLAIYSRLVTIWGRKAILRRMDGASPTEFRMRITTGTQRDVASKMFSNALEVRNGNVSPS